MPGDAETPAHLAELDLEVLEDAQQAVDAADSLADLGDGGGEGVDVETVGEVPVAGDRSVAELLGRIAADHDDSGSRHGGDGANEAHGRRHRVRRHEHDVRHAVGTYRAPETAGLRQPDDRL